MYSDGSLLLPCTFRQLSEGGIATYLFPVIAFVVVILAHRTRTVNVKTGACMKFEHLNS
jgi:hypothetical protein